MTQIPMDTLHAAISKSAAEKASRGNPAATTGAPSPASSSMGNAGAGVQFPASSSMGNAGAGVQFPDTAVRQDLNVLANQAKDYTAGVTAGNLQALEQNANANWLMDKQKTQQDTSRAAQMELEQMQTEMIRQRQIAQAQEAAQTIAEIQARAAAAARGGSGGSDGDKEWLAMTEEAARQVDLDYSVNADVYTANALNYALGNAATYGEAMKLYNSIRRNDPTNYGASDPDLFSAYARSHFDALGSGAVRLPSQETIAKGRVLSATRVAANAARTRTATKKASGGFLGNLPKKKK